VLGFGLDLLMGGGGAGTATTMATSQRNCDTFRQMKAEGKLTNQQFLTVWNNGGCGGGATATIAAQTGAAFMQGYGHGLADGGILAINTFSFDYFLSEEAARIREENAGNSWYAAAQISLNISRAAAMAAAGMWAQGGIASAAANGSVLAWWANAGISGYYVATGSYQVGTGVNMMANGQTGAGVMNMIQGGLSAAGGMGGALKAPLHPNSSGFVGRGRIYAINDSRGGLYRLGETMRGDNAAGVPLRVQQQLNKLPSGYTYQVILDYSNISRGQLRQLEHYLLKLNYPLRGNPPSPGYPWGH
jgi:hypothetical protein